MIQIISLIIFGLILGAIFVLAFFDHKKQRKLTKYPKISFIIPTYNDADTLTETIESLYKSYDKRKTELIIINDKSTDNTLNILKKLKKKYKFKIINNEKNLGKVRSLNKAIPLSRGEIVFILDSDTKLSKRAIESLLARLEAPKVGAVSCRYEVKNKGIIPIMVNIEYSMLALSQSAYNFTSAISLWGGCMAFKRKALQDIKLFKENMIIEDMDAALTLNEKGWKVEQNLIPVETYSPDDIKGWFKQHIRWSSGGMQCIIKHFKVFIKNPLSIFYFLAYGLVSMLFIYSLFSIRLDFLQSAIIGIVYAIFSLPYVIVNMKGIEEWYKIFLILPFSFVYYPIFAAVMTIGFIVGVYKYFKLREGGRGW